jgi:glyoxalase family protein
MQLGGIHHLTAVTANASGNHQFYTGLLGMRLVKKTVNQDDVSAYHLFYADGRGSPGTDLTFFDWPVPRERRGSRSVVRTGFRVRDLESLRWWRDRFENAGVRHGAIVERDGRQTLDFEDPEGQRFSLVEENGGEGSHAWEKSPVPQEHQILGLGPVAISVVELDATHAVLTRVLNMRPERKYDLGSVEVHVYSMGEGGASAELHVLVQPELHPATPGAGGVHHVAFRTRTFEDYERWGEHLNTLRVPNSGPIDRFYFRSLYFREPNGILFEIATDEPGFSADEPLESLGESLALPPFLEPRREQIEAGLKAL